MTGPGSGWSESTLEAAPRWFPRIDTLGPRATILATALVVMSVLGNFVVTAASDASQAVAAVMGLAVLAMSVVGFPLAAVVASKWWGSGRVSADLGLKFRPVDIALGVAGVVVMFGVVIAMSVLLQALGVPQASNLEGFEDNLTAPIIVFLVVLAGVLAPITEELLFRGVLMRGLAARWSPTVAVIGQGVVFGLAHLMLDGGWGNVGLVLPLTGLGIVLGWLARATGRLGPGMLAHALYNLAQVALLVATAD